jgi:hypothetical protein
VPTVNFRVHTGLTPDAVLAALTDFSDNRARVWPNIDAAHYQLHAKGDGWADVTEGNSLAGGIWERNRYDWDPGAGRLTIKTLESSTWAPGSRWIYQLQPAADGGTDVEVKVVRNGQGLKGMLVGIAIALFGARMLRSDMEKVLARVGQRI